MLLWYSVQIIVADRFGFGIDEIRHWFKLSVTGGVTPGWLVAGISHRFPPYFGHLGRNVLLLAVFGGMAERHLTSRQYLGFFFGVGFLTLFLDSAYWWVQGINAFVMGASGAVFGLTGFYCYHSVRHHEDLLSFSPEETGFDGFRQFARTMLVILVPILVTGVLIAELLGIKHSGDSATFAHLSGLLLGFVLDYAVSTGGGRPTVCDTT